MKQALRDALDARGYDTLTPVQEAVLEPGLEEQDLLVSAQTGSGKTLAFGLAIAPTLLKEAEVLAPASAPLGLVIAPTRELALQVKRELGWLFEKAGASLASCVGGMDMRDERRALARGAHLVIATPGRLRDHIMRGTIDLSEIRAVVLDEADEMLDLGFREDLEFILNEAPEERQTLLFSATVPPSIAGLAARYQRNAVRLETKSQSKQHADISYHAMTVAQRDAENAVINTLLFFDAQSAIVFGNTRAMVNRLATRLSNRGLQVVTLSGELSQSERTHALQAMRDGRARICVATDVAARGIDLPNLDLVVHAELPSNHETLLHRSGRTGRAGRKGASALIVTAKTRKKAERLLKMARITADWGVAPGAEAVNAREEERLFADEDWHRAAEGTEREAVEKLTAAFDKGQLATAFLRLYRAARPSAEELAAIDEKPGPRPEFGPSRWFSITGGRDAGAEPRRILPMLLKAGNLDKEDIGAIRIRQDHSLVQVREERAAGMLTAIGGAGVIEEGAVITPSEAPSEGPPDKGRKAFKPKGKPRPEYENAGKVKPRPEHGSEERAKPRSEAGTGYTKKPKTAAVPLEARKSTPTDGAKRKPFKPGGEAKIETPDRKPRKPKVGPKGPPPPKGKATSKKNRARSLAAKAQAKGKPAGKPKRPKA